MVTHIVAWNFKEGLTDDVKNTATSAIKAGLEGLPALIPELKKAQVYTKGCGGTMKDMMLITEFDTVDDLIVYRDHPEHKKVQGTVHEYMCDRVCLDFCD